MTETVQRPVPFQYHAHRLRKSIQYRAKTVQRTVPFQYHAQYCTSSVQRTVPFQYCAHSLGKTKHHGTAHGTTDDFFQDHHTAMTGRTTTKQINPVHIHPETSCEALLEHCKHVHQPTVQVCKPGELLALRKVKHPVKDFCEQTPIDKARHSITIFQLL